MKFVARWLAVFLALLVAAWLVPGIQVSEGSGTCQCLQTFS